MGLRELVQYQADVPSTGALFGLLAGLSILYFTVTSWLSYRRLSHIPGPPLACVSQLWLAIETVRGRVYLSGKDALRKYGSPVRIGPNLVLTDDPEICRAMSAPRSQFVKGHWYKGMSFDPRIDNLLSERDEARHAELRLKAMPGYTGKEVPSLESDIDDRVGDLLRLIRHEFTSKNKTMDFSRLAQYFTLDSLTQIAFGEPFGFLTKNEDVYDYVKSTTAYFPIMEMGTNIPLVHNFLTGRLMQAMAAPKPEDRIGMGRVIGISRKLAAERFGPDAKVEQDMLGSFVKHGMTQQEVESESLLTILAGADSTATTIRTTFLFLLSNPPVYAKLQSEIDRAVAAGNISFPVVKHSEAVQHLPYLQAVIKEGLRMWQPLNGIVTKLVPPDGYTTPNGVRLPPGTQIGVNQANMMRHKEDWGDDADCFRPERWIENVDAETLKRYERVWELTFGYGKTSCLGKGIALMELEKVFTELLRNFDFGIINPVHPIRTRCNAIHTQTRMNLRVWERKH